MYRSTWTNWPMACSALEKTTSSKWCRWYTTTRHRTRTPRTTLSVSSFPATRKKQRGWCEILEGEFHVDLYTLPDSLIKMLWDFTQEKGALWPLSLSEKKGKKRKLWGVACLFFFLFDWMNEWSINWSSLAGFGFNSFFLFPLYYSRTCTFTFVSLLYGVLLLHATSLGLFWLFEEWNEMMKISTAKRIRRDSVIQTAY